MRKHLRNRTATVAVAGMLTLGLAACGDADTDDISDSVEDGVDDLEDGAEDLGEDLQDGAEDLGDELEDGAEDNGDDG